MSAVAAAIGVSAVAGIAGSVMASNSAKKAAKLNAASQANADERNYQMFRESRGEGGSAILPLYLKSQDGRFAEGILGQDTMEAYDAFHQGPESLAGYRNRLDAFSPAVSGARKTANDIFSGGIQKEMQANFEPVKSARVKFKRGAAIDALGKTLNEIKAVQAGQGRSGSDSLAGNMLQFQARKAAGDEVAGANLQNTEEERAINDMALQLRLQNMQLPYAMAKQDMDIFNLPQDTYIDQLLKEQAPFSFFRIGTGNPPQTQPVRYNAIPSTGQLVAQGVGQGAGSLANMYFQNQLQQQYLNAMPNNFIQTPTPSGTFMDSSGFFMPS